MKINILSMLLIGSMLSIGTSLNPMDQEQAVQPTQTGWLLRNGTRADGEIVFCTHLNVISALHGNNGKGGFAVIELVRSCRGDMTPVSKKSGEHLQLYGLVDENHKPYPELKDIIISMAIGDGLEMKIVGPTKH